MDLYTLLNKKKSELSEDELCFIQNEMSLSEFEELQKIDTTLSNINRLENSPNPELREKLANRFHQKKRKSIPIWNTPVKLWKVASIFLVLFSTFWLLKSKNSSAPSLALKAPADTVTLFRNSVTHDTIKICDNSIQKKSKPYRIADTFYRRKNENYIQKNENITKFYDIHIIDMENLKNDNNRSSKSLADDSFVDKFGYVTL